MQWTDTTAFNTVYYEYNYKHKSILKSTIIVKDVLKQ